MIHRGRDERPGPALPQENLAIGSTRRNARSVGRQRDGEQLTSVRRQRSEQRPVGDAPQLHRPVVAGCHQRRTVSRDSDGVDASCVPDERTHLVPVAGINQLCHRAGKTCGDGTAIGQVGDAANSGQAHRRAWGKGGARAAVHGARAIQACGTEIPTSAFAACTIEARRRCVDSPVTGFNAAIGRCRATTALRAGVCEHERAVPHRIAAIRCSIHTQRPTRAALPGVDLRGSARAGVSSVEMLSSAAAGRATRATRAPVRPARRRSTTHEAQRDEHQHPRVSGFY